MNVFILIPLITQSICVNIQRKAMVYYCDESAGGSKYHEKMIEELNSLFQGLPSRTLQRIHFLPICRRSKAGGFYLVIFSIDRKNRFIQQMLKFVILATERAKKL